LGAAVDLGSYSEDANPTQVQTLKAHIVYRSTPTPYVFFALDQGDSLENRLN
jgi:hypothetical protein